MLQRIIIATALAAIAGAGLSPVAAQDAQALGGPVIPGLCMVSRDAVFRNAKVGVAVEARLKALATQAQTEVDAQRTPIDADIKAFQTAAPKLKPEDRTAREKPLAARLQAVQALAAQRTRELGATRVKALQRVATEAQPVIAAVYKQRNCGLLINRDAVLGGNMANDLTAAVVQGLDARIVTFAFDREVAPAAAK